MGGACCTQYYSYKVVDYEKEKKTFRTGDLIFFSGSGVESALIKLFTYSNLTHVGMIIKSDKINQSDDGYYIWHSPSEILYSIPDCISGTSYTGPQLNDLGEVIRISGGIAYVRRLIKRRK